MTGAEEAEDNHIEQCTERGGWQVGALGTHKVNAHHPTVGCFTSEQWP